MVLPTHPSRHWQAERMPGARPPSGDPIYQHRHPMDICTMLDEYCNISLHHFVMAGITKDGKLVTFSGPRETGNPAVLPRYIDLDGYLNWYTTGNVATTPSPSTYEEGYFGHGHLGRHPMNSAYGGRRQYDRRPTQDLLDYEDDAAYRTRKRQRGTLSGRRNHALNAEGPTVQVVLAKRGIKIGNKDEIWKFYDQRFKNIQQSACKIIAKAWVKLIAPKKQSNHPYTGADAKAPDWWPKPWGQSREEKVRHKEPDHLYKPERVYLLNHILRMVTEPNRLQHRDIQKLNINVSKLEEATFEALSGFFADVENPNNGKKKPYLKEIFRVAKYEERYKNGEIDAETEVMVMADDKVPDNWQEEEEAYEAPQEDDNNETTPTSTPGKPEHTLPTIAGTDQNPTGNMPGSSSFIGELPVRGHPYTSSMMQSDLNAGPPSFVEGGSLNVSNQPSMSQTPVMPLPETYSDSHASNRRPSIYTSPTEYGSSSGSNMYQTWNQSNPPTASPVYSFNHQQQPTHPTGAYVEQQPVPLTQTPQYLEAPTFDNMHNAPSSLFRPTSVPQGPVNPHTTHSFPNYLSSLGPRQHTHDDNGDNKRWNP